ncbi:Hypothetical protein A7982_08806 [Minicystis rosea]|nr:Hypothetical protein A7982_08806 [Minicystis rosea]
MNEARANRLMEKLWGTGADVVYAILDGARDPELVPTLLSAGLQYKCLFSGNLSRELARAAPYLVRLNRHGEPTQQLVDRVWGNSAGIFLASPSPLEDLRRHFRRFLQVQSPSGGKLFFRYYDPRVLRVYLPTCDEGELGVVFGPVLRFMLEGANPAEMIVFQRVGRSMAKVQIAWEA